MCDAYKNERTLSSNKFNTYVRTTFLIKISDDLKVLRKNHKINLQIIEQAVHENVDNQVRGLSNDDFECLVKTITTNQAFKKCPQKRKGKNLTVHSLLTFTILDLPVTSSARLISCLIPREIPKVETIQDLMIWTLTNRYRINMKYGLEPLMRWFNCFLQYEIISVERLQSLYELFFQTLDLEHVVSDISFNFFLILEPHTYKPWTKKSIVPKVLFQIL